MNTGTDHEQGCDLTNRLAVELIAKGWTISTAESCTGGGLAHRLTDRPGSSAYFVGSIVAYANRVKQALLDVPGQVICEHGAVSAATADRMAMACRSRFDTDLAVSITGIAGPEGGTPEKPVGLVFVSVATRERVIHRTLSLSGDRADIRRATVDEALRIAFEVASDPASLNASDPA